MAQLFNTRTFRRYTKCWSCARKLQYYLFLSISPFQSLGLTTHSLESVIYETVTFLLLYQSNN